MWPIALLIFAFLIPLIYCAKWKKKDLKNIVLLTACGIAIILLYPISFYLSNILGVVGYSVAKVILFIILPIVAIFYIEKWKMSDILFNVGVRKENLQRSLIYGLIAAVITIVITVVVSITYKFDILWRIVMFFEAFTEEFFFRGILFLYLVQKTNLKVAYSTSIIGFILIHPQHFTSMFIVSTIAQAILLTIVADKTKNIIGPWIAHGLNRNIPSLIRIALGI
jgi:membrane protease YdiL (CAAX protease family)